MKRTITVLSGLLVFLALCQTATAVMCKRCSGKVHDNQFGICRECRGHTSSTATQLCKGCSAELLRCEWCYKKITAEDRHSHDPGKPRPIDPRKSDRYRFEAWQYLYDVNGLGTSRSNISGRLAYGGKEVPPAEINDYYKTPWGYMYWTGSGLVKGKSGWLSTPLTGVGRKGRQLTPQAPGSKVLRVGEAENRREIAVHVGTEISISLPGTPVTGHSWKISKTNGTSIQLLARRPTYVADPGRSGRASAGGTFTFKLKAVKAGRTVVECAYGKGASAYGRPERTFTVTFVVR